MRAFRRPDIGSLALLRHYALLLACLFWAHQGLAAPAEPRIGPTPPWVTPVAPAFAAVHPVDQLTRGVYYLLADRQVRITGPERHMYQHYAQRAVSEKGVESIANIEIRFDPSYQTLTLHSVAIRRGDQVIQKLARTAIRVLQREKELDYLIYDGSKTAHLFLDDVRVNDVVEYSYSLRGSNPVFSGQHFGRIDLQWNVPVHTLHARLLWPSGRALHLKYLNEAPGPVEREYQGYRELVWRKENVPGQVIDDQTPAWYDPYPSVQWGEFKDWAAVAQWAAPLYRVPAPESGELQRETRSIAAAYAAPADRLVETLRYVQRNVRYLGVEVGPGSYAPRAPSTVLARRFGDCKDKTLLMLAMLHGLGIEAHAALVNTRTRRGALEQQPSPGVFNHVLVRARLDGRDYWLDPTRLPQTGTLEAISQADFGYALVVEPQTTGLQAMPAGPATTYKRRIRTHFDSTAGLDKPVKLTVTTVTEGTSAEAMRRTLASQSAEELQKDYQNYYAKYYPELTVAQRFDVRDEADANRLTITEHYRIHPFWTDNRTKTRQIGQVEMPDVLDNLRRPDASIRTQPLALRHPVDFEQTTEVHLPEDWSIPPESTEIADPAFLFTHHLTSTPRAVTVVSRYVSRADHVSAEGTPAYVANLERARKEVGLELYRKYPSAAVPAKSPSTAVRWTSALLVFAVAFSAIWLVRKVYARWTVSLPAAGPETPGPQTIDPPTPHAGSPLAPARLFDLFFRPRRFFRNTLATGHRLELAVVITCLALAGAIDLLNWHLEEDAAKRQDPKWMEANGWLLDHWTNYWMTVVMVALVTAGLYWFLGGWWFRKRLQWSGAQEPAPKEVRRIYAYNALVWTGPLLLLALVRTVFWPNLAQSQPAWWPLDLLMLGLIFWSCRTAYAAATTAFRVVARKALWWFAMVPTAFYLAIIVIAAVRQFQAGGGSA